MLRLTARLHVAGCEIVCGRETRVESLTMMYSARALGSTSILGASLPSPMPEVRADAQMLCYG